MLRLLGYVNTVRFNLLCQNDKMIAYLMLG